MLYHSMVFIAGIKSGSSINMSAVIFSYIQCAWSSKCRSSNVNQLCLAVVSSNFARTVRTAMDDIIKLDCHDESSCQQEDANVNPSEVASKIQQCAYCCGKHHKARTNNAPSHFCINKAKTMRALSECRLRL